MKSYGDLPFKVFKPQLDLSIIPAAGDLKSKTRASIPGVGSSAHMKTEIVDNMTYQGGIGFDLKRDNLSFGVNYNLQLSQHRTGLDLFGTRRYEF